MSFAALAWAAKQRPGNLAAKMVLLGLANFADEHGCSYPSTAALADFGDMDHKTATAALDRLSSEDLRLIIDTGQRAGRTKQIKVYRLNIDSIPKAEGYLKGKPSDNGSLPDLLPKAPQKRGTDTIREPVPQKASPSSETRARRADPFPMPVGMMNSPSAHAKLLRDLEQLSDEEWPPGRLLQHAAEVGWAGIYNPRDREQRNVQRADHDQRSSGRHPGGRTGAAAARVFGGVG